MKGCVVFRTDDLLSMHAIHEPREKLAYLVIALLGYWDEYEPAAV